VIGQPAPLLVPLAEEGWTTGDVPRIAIRRYLEPLARAGVDVVVLGCTHYPLLRELIEDEVRERIGPHVAVVDSAHATALEVRSFLLARGLARAPSAAGATVELLVTDVPGTFSETATRFLGDAVREVEQIDL
jgi:glutamate racemase